jgi:tetratricopeptide (TPR) repeat protein
MSDPIQQLCKILLEKAQLRSTENLSSVVSEVLDTLECNGELTQSLRQDERVLQINTGQSKGYQVVVKANATAYIGDQYHFDAEAIVKTLGELLDEFAKKQPIIGTPHNLPRSGAIAFVGRGEKLEEINQRLQRDDRIAITAVQGMGGIGKTELALQYAIASLRESAYPGGICWLRARGQEITTQIVSFAKANLGIRPPDDMEVHEQVSFTWQRWREGNTLIAIDDVTDYDAIAPYLPPCDPRFKVLLTTRQRLGASITTINLEELSDEAAIALLKSIMRDVRIELQQSDAELLCQWVGNLPLGLELLGYFLVGKPDWSIAKLLERLESQRLTAKALIERKSGMTATLGVAAALELSWMELNEPEQDLACLLGMFAVAPIPWELVKQCFEAVDSDQLEELRDEGLCDRSLIKRVDEETYQIHQIVKEFFREKLAAKNDTKLQSAFFTVMLAQAKILDVRPTLGQIEQVRGAIAHFEEIVDEWIDFLSKEDLILPFLGIGRFYQGRGNYELAESWYIRCFQTLEAVLGNDHPDVANSLSHLVGLYRTLDRYKEAELLCLKALKIQRKSLGDKHLDLATSLNNLAGIYKNQGRYQEVESTYQKALEIQLKSLGFEHPDIATCLNNLAEFYYRQGRHEEAESHFKEALKMLRKVLNHEHIEMAISLNNLALLYASQGKHEEAKLHYQQSLEMKQRLLGSAHPTIATSLNNLANLYSSRGDYIEAEALLNRALEMRQDLFGDEHPSVGESFNNLAYLYSSQMRHEEAASFLQKALDIYENALGISHPATITVRSNLAKCYQLWNLSIR